MQIGRGRFVSYPAFQAPIPEGRVSPTKHILDKTSAVCYNSFKDKIMAKGGKQICG